MLLQQHYKSKDIVAAFKKDRRTIEREIKRGMVRQRDTHLKDKLVYSPFYAYQQSKERVSHSGRKCKLLAADIYKEVHKLLLIKKYSPDAVIGYFKNKQEPLNISTKTLYRLIYKGYFKGVAMVKKGRIKSHR